MNIIYVYLFHIVATASQQGHELIMSDNRDDFNIGAN